MTEDDQKNSLAKTLRSTQVGLVLFTLFASKSIPSVTSISNPEKQRLELALCMKGGNVLSFTNRSFEEFFRDAVAIAIYDQHYARATGSKAHRMRAFWDQADSKKVLQVLELLIEGWDVYAADCPESDRTAVEIVASRIRRDLLHRTVSSSPAPKRIEDMRFSVALSFPGQCRGYVEQIAIQLGSSLGNNRVFYDKDYQAQLARPDLDTLLQNIYHKQAALIVVFLSADYASSEWCGLEWRAVRDIIKRRKSDQVMFVRFDDSVVEGALSIDGYIDARHHQASVVSRFIIERVAVSSTI